MPPGLSPLPLSPGFLGVVIAGFTAFLVLAVLFLNLSLVFFRNGKRL